MDTTQLGAIPLSAEAILEAIALNGEAVAMNQAAFYWGRRTAADPAAVEKLVAPKAADIDPARQLSQSFAETVARRVEFLTAYQDAAYAARYRSWVDATAAAEAAKAPGKTALAEAVALSIQAEAPQDSMKSRSTPTAPSPSSWRTNLTATSGSNSTSPRRCWRAATRPPGCRARRRLGRR